MASGLAKSPPPHQRDHEHVPPRNDANNASMPLLCNSSTNRPTQPEDQTREQQERKSVYQTRGRRAATIAARGAAFLALLLFSAASIISKTGEVVHSDSWVKSADKSKVAAAGAGEGAEEGIVQANQNGPQAVRGRYGCIHGAECDGSNFWGHAEEGEKGDRDGFNVVDEEPKSRRLVMEPSMFRTVGDGTSMVTVDVKQPAISTYPSVLEATVLFLHVFKCAGTTLRELFTGWAGRMGQQGAIVVECRNIQRVKYRERGRVCLDRNNQLIATQGQMKFVKAQKVLAGHFFWGFQEYTRQPYLMVTTLRSPLELAVSAQQFMHRGETDTMERAVPWITDSMKWRIARYRKLEGQDIGFLRRLVDDTVPGNPSNISRDQLTIWGNNAVQHLETFWVVGVVEQYDGLMEVLHHLMDPYNFFPELWNEAHQRKENSSPVSSTNVLRHIDPALVKEFNSTVLELQWQVYEAAVKLWDARCREVLPQSQHDSLCTVPVHPSSYM